MSDEPLDEYLWERIGDGDEQLRTLEELLARYRIDRNIPAVGEGTEPAGEDAAGG